jgi:RNA polymerase sigma factor (sigma-70 family)
MTTTEIGGDGRTFPVTSWTLILEARGDGPDARARLERFVELYWKPVYWYVRACWHKSNEDAKDLTQEFFASLFEREALGDLRGRPRFRLFLRGCLENFLKDRHRAAKAQKRGGNVKIAPIDPALCDLAIADEGAAPNEAFERAWAQTIVRDGLRSLEQIYRTTGREASWRVFELYDLATVETTYEALAEKLGLTRDEVHARLRHARATLKKLVRERVRETVSSPEELEEELALLADAG